MKKKLIRRKPTIAVFADGSCRHLTEPLSRGGYDVMVMDSIGQLHVYARDGRVDLAIVDNPAAEPYLLSVLSPLVESCSVIVVAGAPGADGFGDRITATWAGADAVVATQFDADELLGLVRTVLRRSKRRLAARRRAQLGVMELRDLLRRSKTA